MYTAASDFLVKCFIYAFDIKPKSGLFLFVQRKET